MKRCQKIKRNIYNHPPVTALGRGPVYFTPGDLDRTFYQLLFTCYFSPFSIKGIENAERDGNNGVY